VTTIPSPTTGMRELGDYLRQQRVAANLSVRQLSAVTGISNPYLSQIERGLRRPSAEILQQLAQGLSLSAESLYVRAGLLDPDHAPHGADSRVAIRNDPRLDGPQRRALLDAYARIVGDGRYAVLDVPPVGASTAQPHRAQPTYHQGSKEMYMNATPDTPTDRDMEKSALTPLYAMVGASDLAVEKLVELGHKAAKDAELGIDDLQHRADELGHKANRDMAKAIKGAKHLPQEAVKQAKRTVAKGRQQYVDLARRGKDVDLAGQASTTAQGLIKQAGEIAGRSRKEAGQVVDKGRHQASQLVEEGKQQASHLVEEGKQRSTHLVEEGMQRSSQMVGQGRHEAEKRVAEGRRVARRTRRAAVEQADKVVDQATHMVEAVSHAGRHPMAAAKSVTAEVRKPIARRRRSPGSATTEAVRPVVSAGVDAGATTPTAKAPAAKKAAAKKAATKKAAAKPAAKRSASTPAPAASTAKPRATKRAAKVAPAAGDQVLATPADMPPSPAVTPVVPQTAPVDTPSDKLPASSAE